jgi:hypothetical protein
MKMEMPAGSSLIASLSLTKKIQSRKGKRAQK